MCESKYVIGLDFGTLSGRAVLVRTEDGAVLADSTQLYPHGVMDSCLPDGTPLPPDWALQHPGDYLHVLVSAVSDVIRKSGVSPECVIGMAVDCTGSTVVPLGADRQPLCIHPAYQSRPHAWVKLWKHHAARAEADLFTEAAKREDTDLLLRNGGKISPECLFPKALQVLREDPMIYRDTDLFVEAGDYITLQLTGRLVRSSAPAGLKAFWRKGLGYPSKAFLEEVDARFADFPSEKLRGPLLPLGERAGSLSEKMAGLLGLPPGIAIGVAQLDGHAALPALGICGPGKAMLALGTSTAVILAHPEKKYVEGACSITEDGNLPGQYAYGSGQYCAGDLFEWFVSRCVPAAYEAEAARRGMNIHALLSQKAAAFRPGESGLIALEWWNGNRSVLANTDLTGLVLGMTLRTAPEEIYRALMEAVAFGIRRILDAYQASDIPIDELYACGGIPDKNPLMMQILSDVTGRRIRISRIGFAPAIGAAMLAATAAGAEAGGYANLQSAAKAMHCLGDIRYDPTPQNTSIYGRLYDEYKVLHDYFGRGVNPVMSRLKGLAREARE